MGNVNYIAIHISDSHQIQYSADTHLTLNQHIEPQIKWPSYCRHFQKHFLQQNLFYFDQTSLSEVLKSQNIMNKADIVKQQQKMYISCGI